MTHPTKDQAEADELAKIATGIWNICNGKGPLEPGTDHERIIRQLHRLHSRQPGVMLTEVLQECADSLAEYIEAYYAHTKDYPSALRRYERDMEPVKKARALIDRLTSESLPAKAPVTEQTVLDEAVRTAATWSSDGERIQGTTSMSRYKSPPIEADKGGAV